MLCDQVSGEEGDGRCGLMKMPRSFIRTARVGFAGCSAQLGFCPPVFWMNLRDKVKLLTLLAVAAHSVVTLELSPEECLLPILSTAPPIP